MYAIIWSPTAQETYLQVIDYLLSEWSLDTALKFDDKVVRLLKSLQQFKHFCPASRKQPRYRRCVVTKQTSLVYEIKGKEIRLVTFYDNRTAHSY